MEITPEIDPGQQIKGVKDDHSENNHATETKNEQLDIHNIPTPDIKCEPTLCVPIKDENELEHPEVKTEPLDYLHHDDYDAPLNDKMCMKNEIKSEFEDDNNEQDCELPSVVATCKGCNNTFIRLFSHLQAKDKCKAHYPDLEIFDQLKTKTCKGCHQEFYHLFNHLQQAEQCKLLYSHEEVSCLQTETNQLISTKQKRKYKKLCKFCHKKCKDLLEHLNQSKECFDFHTEQEISSLKLNEKKKKSDGPKTDFSKPCKVCNTSFNRLLGHLRFNKTCKSQYTEEEMEKMKMEHKRESNKNNKLKECNTEDGKAKYRERERFRQMEYRMRKIQEDPAMAREKERLKQLEYRRKKKEEDPEGFRAKNNERKRINRKKNLSLEREKERIKQMEYRKRKMQEDPEGFREKENERKRRHRINNLSVEREKDRLKQMEYRKRKMEEDPEGFRKKVNARKRRNISKNEKERLMERNLTEDPDWFSQEKKGQFKNEELDQMDDDYREVEFIGHEMESSDGCSERDEDNSSDDEEIERVSIKEEKKVTYSQGDNTKFVSEENEDASIKEKKGVIVDPSQNDHSKPVS